MAFRKLAAMYNATAWRLIIYITVIVEYSLYMLRTKSGKKFTSTCKVMWKKGYISRIMGIAFVLVSVAGVSIIDGSFQDKKRKKVILYSL